MEGIGSREHSLSTSLATPSVHTSTTGPISLATAVEWNPKDYQTSREAAVVASNASEANPDAETLMTSATMTTDNRPGFLESSALPFNQHSLHLKREISSGNFAKQFDTPFYHYSSHHHSVAVNNNITIPQTKDAPNAMYFNHGGSELLAGMRQPALPSSMNYLIMGNSTGFESNGLSPTFAHTSRSLSNHSRYSTESPHLPRPHQPLKLDTQLLVSTHGTNSSYPVTTVEAASVKMEEGHKNSAADNIGESESNMEECVVCGDKSSGKHYGQHTCEGCKSFFKRSVRRDLSYTCRGNRSCRVDLQHRNQCQYCRFQKCIKMGMRKEAVQRGRVAPSYQLSASYGSVIGPSSWPAAEPSFPSTPSIAAPASHPPSSIRSLSGMSPAGSTGTISYSLMGLLMKAENSVPILAADNLSDQACQILIGCVEWARRLPHFLDLHLADCLALLTGCWHELFLLNFLQCGLTNSLAPLMSHNLLLDTTQIRLLQDQLDRLGKLYPDSVEMACLKALVLFNPDVASLSDYHHVDSVQESVQCGLEEHVRSTYPRQNSRFGRLLLRLPSLRALSSLSIQQIFFTRSGCKPESVDSLIRDILLGSASTSVATLPSDPHHAQLHSNQPAHDHYSTSLIAVAQNSSPWTSHYPFAASKHN